MASIYKIYLLNEAFSPNVRSLESCFWMVSVFACSNIWSFNCLDGKLLHLKAHILFEHRLWVFKWCHSISFLEKNEASYSKRSLLWPWFTVFLHAVDLISFSLAGLVFLKSPCAVHLQNDAHLNCITSASFWYNPKSRNISSYSLFVQSNKMNLQFSKLSEDWESLFVYIADPVLL